MGEKMLSGNKRGVNAMSERASRTSPALFQERLRYRLLHHELKLLRRHLELLRTHRGFNLHFFGLRALLERCHRLGHDALARRVYVGC